MRVGSVSVIPFPRDLISVGERGHITYDPGLDERVVIDGPDFAKTIAADVAQVLGPAPSGPEAPTGIELQVTRIATSLDRGGLFNLRGTIRGVVGMRGRLAGADPAAPWPWAFEASAETRIIYIRVGDHVETLGTAYCRLLAEVAKRASEVEAAGRAPRPG